MRNIVLDSSVIAKWFFPEEDQGDLALEVKEDFTNKIISISLPLLIFYEVNNLLRTAIKSLRIDRGKAISAYQGFLELDFIVYSSKELMEKALEKAVNLDISSYDASYVVLAEYLKAPFFTTDKKLLEKTKNQVVKNLQNYPV
ncbi:hypothetical protein A3B51_02600 [Candidatus Curtissbacteria bacterium RIFCSPLOWO2_01_FULL_41_18]|uniref:PIN domain-containing protein n=2 Tax=Candidatus Curtissiibacteriota TaxID=1752717 RepID=A0A1F5FYZ5_9BACT|nr:MAG: hypothetical protein A2696_00950 [Candidatus Curtissbacteria bacterium RIFCSPHIGHO2_01_FULL_41_13]OGE05284.1 MAG: hypothetical protein A3B51_02600 [Candidatus Curtissbacteria bacterium RIFCSPLOWO2_01_FULL_41_18]